MNKKYFVGLITILISVTLIAFHIPVKTEVFTAYCDKAGIYDGIPERYSLISQEEPDRSRLKDYPPAPNKLCGVSDKIIIKAFLL